MSLPHAILTALLEKPSSGLELTRRFDKSIGYFWSATHQQIYRELGKLEADGLIRALPAEQPARGQKKSYEVLPAGRAELERWTSATQDPKPMRDTLLLRLRAAAVVGTAGIEADLRRHLELHERQLTEYREIERRDFPPGRDSPQDRLHHLILRAGIDLETFWTRWLAHALEEFAALPDGRAADTGDTGVTDGAASNGGAGTTPPR
ncbi:MULTISPECIES: PadR family transcriptional regulator [Streptomyces]|uniref:PadR family transcriptional regulator n=2 Tax=Streptomyces TaxID=1883 RepID=A0A2U9NX83_STRAS|nr:PadR family transcriptional regulator [Streptomyces actuosus]AWT41465.1 PadR family transcriptional regulator [Streptomyces actuosus]MBM4825971.1 PadR family transcriptional regulator [Streptomyces actuosus]